MTLSNRSIVIVIIGGVEFKEQQHEAEQTPTMTIVSMGGNVVVVKAKLEKLQCCASLTSLHR